MTERGGYLHPFMDGSRFEYGVGENIRTLTELKMCRFSYYIRSQPEWWEKLEKEEVIEEWKRAARSGQYIDETDEVKNLIQTSPLTERQIQWILDELPAMARRVDHSGGGQPSCFERIWESDSSFPVHLRQELCAEIAACYSSSLNIRYPKPQDPTASIIHDFIHPFDYPLLSNRTLCYESEDNVRKLAKAVLSTYVTAIPTDFLVSSSSSAPIEQMGYINNLPPTQHSSHLASLLRQALGVFIPLFESSLTSLHRANHFLLEPRISTSSFKYEKGEDPPDEPGQGIGEGTDDEEDVGLWTVWGQAHHRWVQSRKAIPPDLPMTGFQDLGQWEIAEENRVSLRGKKIQIAVQLNRIELTPERPEYYDSHWKCHGSLDEHVVANGCVVLEESNLTQATLDFRMAVTRPIISYDDPNSACETYWGMRRGSKLNQNIGGVKLSPGKCIVYPNLYQHHLSPFTLLDPTKPGHRTTLQFALVDPEIPVLSSSDVPPQQASWALHALMEVLDKRIPTEVVQRIIDFAVQEKWLIAEEDRWALRAFVDMTRRLDREMLKRFFEESL